MTDAQTPIIEAAYQGLEPAELWRHFAFLNRIPRPSGQEAAACAYVRRVAEAAGATCEADGAANLVVRAAATSGREAAPTVAVQAHLDMVCEKRPEVQHDFSTDPIRPQRQGNRISATGTTLGADIGIGAAAALALLTEPGVQHGPLELIFTVAEEVGLHGALALDASLIRASLLINLDSEDPDELTVGCAGGAETLLHLPSPMEAVNPAWRGCEIVVSGLNGGHSGVQIHESLANAIKLLSQVLQAAQVQGVPFRVHSVSGGSAHNAIPRDAKAFLAVAPDALAPLEAAVDAARARLQEQWHHDEPDFALELRPIDLPPRVLQAQAQDALLHLLEALPHGVLAMSGTFAGVVQTSTNLARVKMAADSIEIATSSRSFVDEELEQTQARIQALGVEAGAATEARDGYPGWEPHADSRLLQVAQAAFQSVYGRPASVQVVHAGLECGVIVAKKPGMEAISFGPLIRGAHTPEEWVDAATVEPTWQLLTTLLADLS